LHYKVYGVVIVGTWNKGYNYNELKELYEKELKELGNEITTGEVWGVITNTHYVRYAYLSTLYTQLLNGCRICEATEALQEAVKRKEYTQVVKVGKTGKKRTVAKLKIYRNNKVKPVIQRTKSQPKYRVAVIPNIINLDYCSHILKSNPHKITDWTKKYFKRKYGIDINTHTNRYAFITYLILEKNINPVEVQKITKHTDINLITHYTASEEAINILKELQKDK